MSNKAIILLSGGLDSATVLGFVRAAAYEIYCLSFQYGQKQSYEIECAKKLAISNKAVEHKIVQIDPILFSSSALTSNLEVPKNVQSNFDAIPSTYVPARNTIFLAYALAYAETIKANNIFLGCNIVDYSNYPDCRPDYLKAYEKVFNLASARLNEEIRIQAPLLYLSKSQIIQLGTALQVDYSMTLSCYDPSSDHISCGLCDACNFRKNGFIQAGLIDPIVYNG